MVVNSMHVSETEVIPLRSSQLHKHKLLRSGGLTFVNVQINEELEKTL